MIGPKIVTLNFVLLTTRLNAVHVAELRHDFRIMVYPEVGRYIDRST